MSFPNFSDKKPLKKEAAEGKDFWKSCAEYVCMKKNEEVNVQCTMYIVHCTLYGISAYTELRTVYCVLYSVVYTLQGVPHHVGSLMAINYRFSGQIRNSKNE